MRKILYLVGLSVALLPGMAPPAQAEIITPAGLNPGDQFRIVFVSSTTRNASSAIIGDYDEFITTRANAAGLTYNGTAVTWFALGSTEAVSALSRLPASSPALYRIDGVKVADSGSDLWDASIAAPIEYDETGTLVQFGVVWTGTTSGGSQNGAAVLGASEVTAGRAGPDHTGPTWVTWGVLGQSNQFRIYGYSEVLTVPGAAAVPEPASLTLAALGLAGLAGYGWRRRKRAA